MSEDNTDDDKVESANDEETVEMAEENTENENVEMAEEESDDDEFRPTLIKGKRGVVYIGYVPPGMTPTVLRQMLSKYAPIGRLYLQPIDQSEGGMSKQKWKMNYKKRWTGDCLLEGWVEFIKKRHAREVAALLHNTKIGGKKRSPYHDCLWNLKYLPRFKWVHLQERLNYEYAVFKQQMINEVMQAKRVAYHFKETVEREERMKKLKKRSAQGTDPQVEEEDKPLATFFKQIPSKRKPPAVPAEKREDFLKSLFS